MVIKGIAMEKVEAYELHKLPIFITRGKRNPDIDLRIDSKQSSLLKYYDKKIKEAFISKKMR